jgi:DNA-binding GntR family transcriptional regulator
MTTERQAVVGRGARSASLSSDRVFEELKREIIELRLPPDEIVVEGSLAAHFGLSKAPIREALKRLEQVRLVRSLPRVGYVVSSVNLGDIDDIFAMRLALEPLAACLATERMSDDELDELEVTARVPLSLDEEGDARGPVLARANTEFHQAVAQASGNERLGRTVGALVDDLERVMNMLAYVPDVFDRVAHQHVTLVGVMRSRDTEGSAATMHSQLEYDQAALRAAATSQRQPSDLRVGARAIP